MLDMKNRAEVCRNIVAYVLIVILLFGSPFEALAQLSADRSNVLETGTQMVLRVTENFKSANKADSGVINAMVESDVYSADGTRVLVKGGTPAYIEFTLEQNGYAGKSGKICLTYATTKTIDHKNVSLRIGACKNGGSRLGGVVILSILFFPIGLVSCCMKGRMPKIAQGTEFKALTMQDVAVDNDV